MQKCLTCDLCNLELGLYNPHVVKKPKQPVQLTLASVQLVVDN